MIPAFTNDSFDWKGFLKEKYGSLHPALEFFDEIEGEVIVDGKYWKLWDPVDPCAPRQGIEPQDFSDVESDGSSNASTGVGVQDYLQPCWSPPDID